MEAKALMIDLTDSTYRSKEIPGEVLEKFIGGRGLGAYLLYKEVGPGIDPLGEENALIFTAGPAQGTHAPYGSRSVLNTKSPLTGIYLYSIASGNLGHHLKKAGFSAVIIKGKSPRPVYLKIEDEHVAFVPAEHLWGLTTRKTQELMLGEAGLTNAATACIGPAGEKLIKIAAVITGGEKARTFGRGGAGAVFGAKNLKGLLVHGSGEVKIAQPEAFKAARNDIYKAIKRNPNYCESQRRFGTGNDLLTLNQLGILPTLNWRTGRFEGAEGIAPTEIEVAWPRKNTSCGPYCFSPCGHQIRLERGAYQGAFVEGPEYETIYAFGSNCGVNQFDAIVAAEEICDEYGLDSMSCGVAIGFAMECMERGLLSAKEIGLDLSFGNAGSMVEMTRQIAAGKGLGLILGQGVKEAAKNFPGSEKFAMHCKGMEFGGYECRGSWGQALQYALNSRGGCHHGFGLPARSELNQDNKTKAAGKGELVKGLGAVRVAYDCAIMCTFPSAILGLDAVAKIVNSLLGTTYSTSDLIKAGIRIMTLERLFNTREGICRQNDYLPYRLLNEPLPEGPNRGSIVDMDALLDDGYQAFGWDKNGVPLRKTVQELEIEDLLA